MKGFKKGFVIVLVLAMMAAMLVACSTPNEGQVAVEESENTATVEESVEAGEESAEVASDEKLTFALSVMVMDNPYFIAVAKGFEDRCAELGIESVVNDAQYDVATQYSQVENYISMGVDAMCIPPLDPKGIQDIVSEAQEAGIIVVGEAQGIENADANVIVDDYAYGVASGKNAVEWINEKLGGEAQVLIISQDDLESVMKRGNGIEDTIKAECPNAEIVARQSGDTPETAMEITETVLQAHPDVNVIVCGNDSNALGALEAVRNMGIDNPDFFIGGADNTDEAIAKMKEEGSYFRSTIDIDPYGTGAKCVDVMLDYVQNGSKGETFYFDMIPIWQDEL